MNDKRIIYTDGNGKLHQVILAPNFIGDINELAGEVVPNGLNYRIIGLDKLPKSRNWRDAWTDENATETVDVDLNKAMQAQRSLIITKGFERVEADEFGQQDFSLLLSQLNALNLNSSANLTELYNKWPECIERRNINREYIVHE